MRTASFTVWRVQEKKGCLHESHDRPAGLGGEVPPRPEGQRSGITISGELIKEILI